jgi:hypothetical protein
MLIVLFRAGQEPKRYEMQSCHQQFHRHAFNFGKIRRKAALTTSIALREETEKGKRL